MSSVLKKAMTKEQAHTKVMTEEEKKSTKAKQKIRKELAAEEAKASARSARLKVERQK